ncbi:MAG: hypothetical protein ACLFVD_02460 [Dehalococcoidia bacterium]
MTGSKSRRLGKRKGTGGGQPWYRTLSGRLPRSAWVFVAVLVIGVVVLAVVRPWGSTPPDNTGTPRAAIVDQLYNLQPNEEFIAEVTSELEDYGFEVDLYQGDDITVDFYRDLASRGHRLILFRVHSGLVIENGQVLQRTLLFTNEGYSASKYPAEQLSDRLGKGSAAEGEPMMFGITAGFVASSRSMPGEFDDTAIIMMGCSALFYDDLAKAFVARGASVYLGWHGSVNLNYVDEATPYLMRQLCSGNATITEAVESTMEVIGPDPRYLAELRFYPRVSEDKTMAELLQLASEGE